VLKTDTLYPRYPGSKFPPVDRLKGILWEFSEVMSIPYGKYCYRNSYGTV